MGRLNFHPSVHPTVISDKLDGAAAAWMGGRDFEARRDLHLALEWFETPPTRYDRIALQLREFEDLREHHPVRPILQRRLQQWLGQLQEQDREQWRRRMAAAD